jgi:hypothetical protein
MSTKEKLVAIVSPWEKLNDLAKRHFRVESLPAEKRVMVWRDDLQSEKALLAELKSVGILSPEIRKATPKDWKGMD